MDNRNVASNCKRRLNMALQLSICIIDIVDGKILYSPIVEFKESVRSNKSASRTKFHIVLKKNKVLPVLRSIQNLWQLVNNITTYCAYFLKCQKARLVLSWNILQRHLLQENRHMF